MTASAPRVAPAQRPIAEQEAPVPFRLPWPRARIACRPVIGDALLLHYAVQERDFRCTTELTVRQARETLTTWAAERRALAGRRDALVRAAVAAGLSKAEIQRLTGIARTTIGRIVGPPSEAGEGDA
jgi:hypothetical protein